MGTVTPLSRSTDVVVVGGGVIGMLSARELILAGLRVTVLERGATGRESTWAGGGILSPLYPWRYPDPVSHLALWSQGIYPELAEALREATGIDPEWTRNGLLILDPGEAEPALAWGRRFQVEVEILSPDAARALEPGLHRDTGGVWLPQVAQIRNPRLAKALRAHLLDLGVRIEEGVTVTGLLRGDEGVAGVETDAGPRRAGKVVVCAGAWTGRLLAQMGAPAVPVRPVRGQMLLYRAPRDTVHHILIRESHYLIPRRDGRVLVGSTMEETGFDKTPTPDAAEELARVAESLVPALARCPREAHWAGLRPGSPDGVPFIGPLPGWNGLYVNAGHFRNGVVTAPASARLLADLVLGRPPILDPGPYRFKRVGEVADNPQ